MPRCPPRTALPLVLARTGVTAWRAWRRPPAAARSGAVDAPGKQDAAAPTPCWPLPRAPSAAADGEAAPAAALDAAAASILKVGLEGLDNAPWA